MQNIGTIYVSVKGDTTAFEKSMKELRGIAKRGGTEVSNALNNAINPTRASMNIGGLANDLKQLAQSSKAPIKNFTNTSRRMAVVFGEVADSIGMSRKEFKNLYNTMLKNQALQTAEKSLKGIGRASGLSTAELTKLASKMGYTEKESLKLSGQFGKLQLEAYGMNKAFMATRAEAKKAAIAFDKAHKEALGMNKAFDKAKRSTMSLRSHLSSMKGTLFSVGLSAAAATYTVKRLSETIWDAGQRTLVAENAYKSITGSTAAANKQFGFLSETAKDLGLNFYTLREGYKGFLAAAQSSTLPMKEIQGIFRSVSNAGAILGLSNEKMSLTFLALEQMLSKGKISMEEIRRQMGDSLPGAFQLGAKAMGMTVEAFDKAVSAGKIYADDFLPKFSKAMDKMYIGTIADSVKAVNKLKEAWESLLVDMSKG
ncbi:MAG: hypothetical protein DRH26_15560, partial [Deltaproteobacteria bacterium]